MKTRTETRADSSLIVCSNGLIVWWYFSSINPPWHRMHMELIDGECSEKKVGDRREESVGNHARGRSIRSSLRDETPFEFAIRVCGQQCLKTADYSNYRQRGWAHLCNLGELSDINPVAKFLWCSAGTRLPRARACTRARVPADSGVCGGGHPMVDPRALNGNSQSTTATGRDGRTPRKIPFHRWQIRERRRLVSDCPRAFRWSVSWLVLDGDGNGCRFAAKERGHCDKDGESTDKLG